MKTLKRSRATVVCIQDQDFLSIELKDPTTLKRMWSLPGGMIEEDETPEEAAIRETLEETGYLVALHATARVVTQYLFRWNALTYDCTTYWYAATLANDHVEVVQDAQYLLGHRWLPVHRIAELLSYHPHIRDVTMQLARVFESEPVSN